MASGETTSLKLETLGRVLTASLRVAVVTNSKVEAMILCSISLSSIEVTSAGIQWPISEMVLCALVRARDVANVGIASTTALTCL